MTYNILTVYFDPFELFPHKYQIMITCMSVSGISDWSNQWIVLGVGYLELDVVVLTKFDHHAAIFTF